MKMDYSIDELFGNPETENLEFEYLDLSGISENKDKDESEILLTDILIND